MIRKLSALLLASMVVAHPCGAALNYQAGHINDITVTGDVIMVKLDSGLPDNCSGTAYGWMMIPADYKAVKALVLALWARGDMSSVPVQIYTDGLVNNYCQVNQIDPL